jgi:hypothetical protein
MLRDTQTAYLVTPQTTANKENKCRNATLLLTATFSEVNIHYQSSPTQQRGGTIGVILVKFKIQRIRLIFV